MFLYIFAALIVCTCGDNLKPKFQVLTPDELMVQVPHYADKKLVTLRMGVRRAGHDADDLEIGENEIRDDRVFIFDQRLKLKEGDVVNYLLVFKDREGYQTQSGNYEFNGVYYKKPFNRHRYRRHLLPLLTTEEPAIRFQESTYSVETEEFDPTASRFGGGHHHRGHWGGHHGFGPYNPHRGYPSYLPQGPNNFGPQPPNFGADCNDHRHDRCHGRDTERWESATTAHPTNVGASDLEYHCKICNSFGGQVRGVEVSTTTTTTTTEIPDIDIRFQ